MTVAEIGMHRSITLLALSLLASIGAAARDGFCPPLGAVLPAPTSPSSHHAVKAAILDIENLLENSTSAFNASGIAVGVKSIHEDSLLLEYAFTPPELDPRGVKKIDSDTVFRLASISKIFPVLSILKLKGVSLDDPITEYLPELRELKKQAREQNAIWTVEWDEITIGALASHLGGIGVDMFTDLQPFGNFTSLGFPPEDPSRNLNCSGILGTDPCPASVFHERYGERAPVFAPFSASPAYANVGWYLIGRVIEKVTDKSPAEYIKENIWKPAGMHRTFAGTPDNKLGFIMAGDIMWNASIGFEGPAGDYYSTINDLHAFGDALLKHKLLSPAKTRKWLKPAAFTSSRGEFLGEPWEIWRTQNVTKDGRVIDIYTKTGDLITYHSIIALVPDYDLVITMLVNGLEVNGGTTRLTVSNIVEILLPALEEAGKAEAEEAYGGTYSDSETNSTLTLAIDDAPGFAITNWIVRGADVMATYLSIGLPPVFPTPPGLVRFRLYPTTIKTDTQSSWRSLAAIGTPEETEAAESGFVWDDALCSSWVSVDRMMYQLAALDHFVFTESADCMATELELVGYRVTLKKEA